MNFVEHEQLISKIYVSCCITAITSFRTNVCVKMFVFDLCIGVHYHDILHECFVLLCIQHFIIVRAHHTPDLNDL